MPALFSLLVLDPKLRKLRLACALLFYVAILVGGSIPGARAGIGAYAPSGVLHSCAYAVLAFLWFTGSSGSPAMRAVKSVLAVALMGAGDELVQSFLPYRVGAVGDWIVDCAAGVVTSSLLWALLPSPATAKR